MISRGTSNEGPPEDGLPVAPTGSVERAPIVGELELSQTAQHWVNVTLIWVGFGTLAGLLARLLIPGREPSGAVGTVLIGIVFPEDNWLWGPCLGMVIALIVLLVFPETGKAEQTGIGLVTRKDQFIFILLWGGWLFFPAISLLYVGLAVLGIRIGRNRLEKQRWDSDEDFRNMEKISDANPQQAEYLWGSAEIVEWISNDRTPLQGILIKPEGFDPSKKYPMMVYFYERMSDGLHRYNTIRPGSSSVIPSFYVSRGYVFFIPDIPYEIGHPGESAIDAVVPGVLKILDEGYVDPDRIGVQGHSWGGYQIAYMVTRTNLFAAAEAGAPVSNMTSAYGGIRWQTGMSRQFQYERTQSRIGGSLWEETLRYINNSPLFEADKVQTPVLMLHNDEDGAVPWYQGIEYYMALRRLQKPVWTLNYNGEAHGLRRRANQKDWMIRMQQFFDHYLLDAPAPVWMEKGVPAVEKGKTLGLELVKGGGS